MAMILKVDTPKDGVTVNTSTVTVSGRINGTESSNAKVTINGADTPVKDGRFAADIKLTEGNNVISIEATGGQSNQKEQRIVTYTPAK